MIKKHFDKNLIMTEEDEERLQLSNIYWICDKLFDAGDKKEGDHCNIIEKYRGSENWICNINIKFTKEDPAVFHNLRAYDSHLIMQ